MSWRLRRSEFENGKGEANRLAMKTVVDSKISPGILAFHEGKPVGWCSIGPREQFSYLDRSRIFARIDDEPVWSVVCFFIKKEYRRQGIAVKILKAAVEFARSSGARIIEGYPKGSGPDKLPDAFVWNGLVSTFEKAGFEVAERRSKNRPLMRLYL